MADKKDGFGVAEMEEMRADARERRGLTPLAREWRPLRAGDCAKLRDRSRVATMRGA
jgi:hypothetical protein